MFCWVQPNETSPFPVLTMIVGADVSHAALAPPMSFSRGTLDRLVNFGRGNGVG